MIGKIKKIGNDLLFHAINHANVHDVIALLEENEVDVNCANINGHTPLHVIYQFLL
jgi:ankyrin repeat protein